MSKLSIIIVNYNTGALTHSCVESLLADKLPAGTEIIVVDNASSDESVSFLRSDFPEIRVIVNHKNKGLAYGVNRGIAAANGKYYLFLNPDIIALPGGVGTLVDFMDRNQKVGVAGGKLLSPNGKLQYSTFRFYTPRTILSRRTWLGQTKRGQEIEDTFLMKDFDHESVRDVQWLMGSCLMVRAEAVRAVGGMDERFFLYFEDVDWCRRFWETGWRVTYVPQANFSHFHQQSSRQNSLFGIIINWSTREHIWSAIKYFWKYRGKEIPGVD
ncbi:MAG: glycosyltransferase family 2 protein [Candidatus Andersenbacteria bacterium]|nr:glycosyltransferase family 2 protein [bacterium]MDZ4225798.1 glycosyltransferase family 2 protein [Candidatus Andersenbacteria bacterium]